MKFSGDVIAFTFIGLVVGLVLGRSSAYFALNVDPHVLADNIISEHKKLGLLVDTGRKNHVICAQGALLVDLVSGDAAGEDPHALASEFLEFYLLIFSEYVRWSCPVTARRLQILDGTPSYRPDQ